MKYCDFEEILSEDRMRRYVKACGGNKKKGMTLYRYNLNLAGEMLKNYFPGWELTGENYYTE